MISSVSYMSLSHVAPSAWPRQLDERAMSALDERFRSLDNHNTEKRSDDMISKLHLKMKGITQSMEDLVYL